LELEMKNKGFTLIELVIALAIFSIVALSMSSIAFSIIQGQRKAFALQNTQEVSRHILESMSKEIRMSAIVTGAGNFTGLSITDVDADADGLMDDDVDYQFDNTNNRLRRQINGGVWQDLNPTELEVTGAFYIKKDMFPVRAMVTIVMTVRSATDKAESRAEIYLQSSVSSRMP